MTEVCLRMIEPDQAPTLVQVEAWIGRDALEFWHRMTQWIERNYPNVFAPEWLFGGKKYGWSLRYKKSKSFCTLIPEKNACRIQIVFGTEERKKVEEIQRELTHPMWTAYENAKTYHDGKWLLLTVDSEETFQDITRFLMVKRTPKPSKS